MHPDCVRPLDHAAADVQGVLRRRAAEEHANDECPWRCVAQFAASDVCRPAGVIVNDITGIAGIRKRLEIAALDGECAVVGYQIVRISWIAARVGVLGGYRHLAGASAVLRGVRAVLERQRAVVLDKVSSTGRRLDLTDCVAVEVERDVLARCNCDADVPVNRLVRNHRDRRRRTVRRHRHDRLRQRLVLVGRRTTIGNDLSHRRLTPCTT